MPGTTAPAKDGAAAPRLPPRWRLRGSAWMVVAGLLRSWGGVPSSGKWTAILTIVASGVIATMGTPGRPGAVPAASP